jgi:hypothetical protein
MSGGWCLGGFPITIWRSAQDGAAVSNRAAVTLFSSLKFLTFRLWDEERHRLVGFSHL